jgi:hypothetical protein
VTKFPGLDCSSHNCLNRNSVLRTTFTQPQEPACYQFPLSQIAAPLRAFLQLRHWWHEGGNIPIRVTNVTRHPRHTYLSCHGDRNCARLQTCLGQLCAQQNGVRCRDVCVSHRNHVGHASYMFIARLLIEHLHMVAVIYKEQSCVSCMVEQLQPLPGGMMTIELWRVDPEGFIWRAGRCNVYGERDHDNDLKVLMAKHLVRKSG